jgi:hypothetical protein
VRGGERPQWVSLNLVSGSAHANLLAGDYQELLPDSAGDDRIVRLASADSTRRYALVPDVSGYFG